MPDPQLEFRNLALDNYVGIRLDVVRGFLTPPQMRGEDVIVPALVGRVSRDRVADVLTIVLEGYVAGTDPEDWRAKTDQLIAVLDEHEADPGPLIARAPYLGLGIGDEATISARVRNYIEGPIRAGATIQTWSIELESTDPYWVVAPGGS